MSIDTQPWLNGHALCQKSLCVCVPFVFWMVTSSLFIASFSSFTYQTQSTCTAVCRLWACSVVYPHTQEEQAARLPNHIFLHQQEPVFEMARGRTKLVAGSNDVLSFCHHLPECNDIGLQYFMLRSRKNGFNWLNNSSLMFHCWVICTQSQ